MDKRFSVFGRIKGVQEFIVLDRKQRIVAHNMAATAPLATLVYTCSRRLVALGKENFKYACFSRRHGNDVLIFPVGNYYLGVVKQEHIRNSETVSAVLEHLDALIGKQGLKGELS